MKKIKNLKLWMPFAVAACVIAALVILDKLFEAPMSVRIPNIWLVYLCYESYFGTMAAAVAVIGKTTSKMDKKDKIAYWIISFLILSNTYYFSSALGLMTIKD